MVLTRRTAQELHPVAVQAWTAISAAGLILPLLAVFHGRGIEPLDPVLPHGRFWLFLAGVGITAAVSHVLVGTALRHAPASTIAPLQYLEIVSATALGFAIFSDWPDWQTMLGIAIIISSGLFVFLRERSLDRIPDRPPAPPPG